jgi:flagellar hook-associated protein 1 FlgK
VGDLAGDVAAAQTRRQADALVRENLASQQAAISGVNADEETINLLQSQRAYQASARFLSTVDEMLQTLMNI